MTQTPQPVEPVEPVSHVLVQFYADAAPEENPLGLSSGYPWKCSEHKQSALPEVPAGQQLMTLQEYASLRAYYQAEYSTKHAAWVATQEDAQ